MDPASLLVSVASGYSFVDFLTHSMPIVIVASIVTLIMIRILFSEELSVKPEDPEVVEKLVAKEALTDPSTARKLLAMLGLASGYVCFPRKVRPQHWVYCHRSFLTLFNVDPTRFSRSVGTSGLADILFLHRVVHNGRRFGTCRVF